MVRVKTTSLALLGSGASLALALACSKGRVQVNPRSPADSPYQTEKAEDRLPEIPTNPEGGVDPNRIKRLSPEENSRRIAENTKKPIVLGESAAGVSLATTYKEGLDILSDPVNIYKTQHVYNESVRIIWHTEAPEVPALIIVDPGYEGVFELPEKYGKPKISDSLTKFFPEGEEKPGETLIRDLGRYFYKKGADFDCLATGECALSEGNSLDFAFRSFGFYVSKDAKREIELAYIEQPPTPPRTDLVVFGKGIGSATMNSTRDEIKKIFGRPIQGRIENMELFDNQNIVVEWIPQEPKKPDYLQVQGDYAGTIKMPSRFGTVKLGQDMTSFFASDPEGQAFVKEMGRFTTGKGADYDCLAAEECVVQISEDNTQMVVGFEGGILVFAKGEKIILGIARVLSFSP